jgi:uncharacterized membrane protein YfcA
MRLFTILPLSLLFFLGPYLGVSAAESDSKCANSNLYECPTETCNGTIYVNDCLDCDGFYNTDTKNDVCFDRKLLNGKDNPDSSYLWRDILGILVWFCAAGVATACGVGGGGIYVPLGILLLNFAPKPSSGLSQASIFGASLGGLLLNIRNRHPFTAKVEKGGRDGMTSVPTEDDAPQDTETTHHYSRPLIDYDMALFLAPMEMAGAVLGVLIQKILPNWLYLTLAAIILGFTSHKTYKKYADTHAKEQAVREAAEQEEEQQQEPTTEQLPSEPIAAKNNTETIDNTADLSSEEETNGSKKDSKDEEVEVEAPIEETKEAEQESIDDSMIDPDKVTRREFLLEQDSRQYPRDKLLALFVLWVGLILLTFFKGGKGVDSIVGITCASPWYGVLIAIQFMWTLGFAGFFGWKLLKTTEEKQALDYPWHPQDVLWDSYKIRFYAAFTFVAGIVAGLIGIGGGMVLGPLMLVMGIHPRVSSATTATMIVMTSSSVAVLFVTAGLVPWEYAITFFCVCLTGAYIGKTQIDGHVKRTGKASLLIFLLATIIALATIGCVVIVITRLSASGWCFTGFHKFCNLSDEDSDEDRCEIDRFLFGGKDL